MKKQIYTALIVSLILISALFIDTGNAASQGSRILQSSGRINQGSSVALTVILRNIGVLSGSVSSISAQVDSFVSNHPYVTAITISDMHQYGIWWYGYSFSQTNGTWMGATFTQLKTMIDRFHFYGWTVGLESTGIAWNNQQEYNYITIQHPELAFTDANGLKATGVDNPETSKNPGYNKVIPDFFAKFATADTTNNITVGTRLIDLYTTRLKQMILDGLQWDFWFGTDGWNGVSNQGYYWNSKTASKSYGFSIQEENEFGNWTGAILPLNWATLSQTQKANAIIGNQTILNNWWYYWQIRFAQMYAQIKQAFIDAGESPSTFHLIGSSDTSSAPSNPGILSPAGMYNMSLLAQYNAVDYIYVDQEWASPAGSLGQNQAYVGALVKMQEPSLVPIIGLQPQDYKGGTHPLWEVKQSYLAQAVNYAWYNGIRYRVSAPNVIMMQYSFGTWTKEEIAELFAFIQATTKLLSNAQPSWLGPLYATPSSISAMGNAWYQLNWSFAQWAWTSNLQNNPQSINPSMGTIIMDEALQDTGPSLVGLNDAMIDLWSSNKLNIWYWENSGRDWGMSSVWAPPATASIPAIETQVTNNFHIVRSYGNSGTYAIPNKLTDSVASQIASGYESTSYTLSANQYYVRGVYLPTSGFVTIANFTADNPNRIAIGYYRNATTSNFLLTHMANVLPKDMVNKMLYWASNSPINTSEPLIDLKILNNGDTLIIPMINQRDSGSTNISSTLSINPVALGLGNPSNYRIYWASSSIPVAFTDWNSVQITLNGMADSLVISRS